MTQPSEFPHSLSRTVHIRATRTTVFGFFTDTARFASWWGPGSTIDPRPGGEVLIRYPNGIVARGEVVELETPRRVVFTFGYESGQPIAPGSSLVTVQLDEEHGGTTVALTHEFADARACDQHVPGWRYQLALFANVATAAQHQGLEATVDAFFSLWEEADAALRLQRMQALCTADVTFRDAHACLRGIPDLSAHVAASQQFMPGVHLRRQGPVRHCQGTCVVDWQMARGDEVLGSGCNVLELAGDSQLAGIVGIQV